MPIQPKQQPPYYTPQQAIQIYTAGFTQNGTDPPVVRIIANTIGDIIWTWNDISKYCLGTLNNAFIGDILTTVYSFPTNGYWTLAGKLTDSTLKIQNGYNFGTFAGEDSVLNEQIITFILIKP